jgi:hypothetical protein
MAQIKVETWTNPSTAVAKDFNLGFEVAEVVSIDITNGGSWQWLNGMGDGYYLDVDAGTVTTSNGATPLDEDATYGSAISAFTNANPGVITVADAVQGGFVAGDTIKVTGIAESGSGATLNAEYTIASISGNALTTATDTSSGAVYVSGGNAIRVSNAANDAIAVQNVAQRGITLGTGMVGANDASMIAIFKGAENVT